MLQLKVKITHLCHFSKRKFNLLSVCYIYPLFWRYSTYWDRKGWPGSEIKMYHGCPWNERLAPWKLIFVKFRYYFIFHLNIISYITSILLHISPEYYFIFHLNIISYFTWILFHISPEYYFIFHLNFSNF